jgi:hypothetical protein
MNVAAVEVRAVDALKVDRETASPLNAYLRLKWFFKLLVILTIATAVFIFFALYFYNPPLFARIASILWEFKEAVILLAVSLTSSAIIASQVDKLTTEIVTIESRSIQAVNQINIATGKLDEANTTITVNIAGLRDIVGDLRSKPENLEGAEGQATLESYTEKDYWTELSDKWAVAKMLVEEKILQSVNHPKRFEKYANMPRYKYVDIVNSLISDGLVVENARQPFEEMQSAFNEFRPQKYMVEKEQWDSFLANFNKFKKHV